MIPRLYTMAIKSILAATIALLSASTILAQGSDDGKSFPYPIVPDSLRTPNQRATFVLAHYWDRFDFNDTTLLHIPEITEQGFANFIDLLPRVAPSTAAMGITAYANHIYMSTDSANTGSANERVIEYFSNLTDKYLGDSDSPLHNDLLYAQFLDAMSANKYASAAERTRNNYMARNLRKNLPGSVAADFEYIDRNGLSHRMHNFKAKYTVIYFYDPDCNHCREVTDELRNITSLTEENSPIRVLTIYAYDDAGEWNKSNMMFPKTWTDGRSPEGKITTDDIYYIKSMPSVYLLDEGKRVLLKNPNVNLLRQTLDNLLEK